MDLVTIILIALVALFIFILYYFSRAVSLLQGVSKLNEQKTIPGTTLTTSNGKTVYYDFWVFINSATGSDNILIKREFQLLLNGTTLKLKTADAANGRGDIGDITSSFPMNKWVFVALNINEKVVETYVNGKLIKTISMGNPLAVANTTDLLVGSSGITGYITKLRRLNKPMGPDFVWSKYLEGNGQFSGLFGSFFNYFDSYSAKVTLDDGTSKKDIKLF